MTDSFDKLHKQLNDLNKRLNAIKGDYDDSKHPRDDRGRFASGGMSGQDYEHHLGEGAGRTADASNSLERAHRGAEASNPVEVTRAAREAATHHTAAADHFDAINEPEVAQAHRDAASAATGVQWSHAQRGMDSPDGANFTRAFERFDQASTAATDTTNRMLES